MAGNDSETTCDIREVFPWFKCRFALRAGVAVSVPPNFGITKRVHNRGLVLSAAGF